MPEYDLKDIFPSLEPDKPYLILDGSLSESSFIARAIRLYEATSGLAVENLPILEQLDRAVTEQSNGEVTMYSENGSWYIVKTTAEDNA